MSRRFVLLAALAALWKMPSGHAQSPPYDEALKDWSTVLATYVDEAGRTDFRKLAGSRIELDRFVDYIGRVSPASRPEEFPTRAQVLAYHLNAYNTLAMHGVIETGIPAGFSSFFKRAAFFKFRRVVIGGETTSLADYENDVIRPLEEPRVHFALNCMVRSCPRLRTEPYRAEVLEAQLDAGAREFFTTEKHIRIDTAEREVWLSEILDFYTEDFTPDGKPQSLIAFVNRFRSVPIDASYRVRFIPYDWTLNQQP